MKILRRMIEEKGRYIGGGILDVTEFLNHRVDPHLMSSIGVLLASSFLAMGVMPEMVLTAEVSGIAPALETARTLGVPMVYARKERPFTLAWNDCFHSPAVSRTKGSRTILSISREVIRPTTRVLIIDDFLAKGETVKSLADLVKRADARLVGVGVAIEKEFEGGRRVLAHLGVPIVSLVNIKEISDNGKIVFA